MTPAPTATASAPPRGRLAFFRPSHQHTATSATILLGFFALLSRVIGLVRDKYIAHTFGAGPATDAYNVAFQLPDLLSYLLVGGAASISFVTILSRYRERGEHAAGDRALSVILNTMLFVLGGAILLAETLAPLYTRAFFAGAPAEVALSTALTRILLPAQIFFFAGGVLTSVTLVRKQFTYQGISPLIYTAGIILGGILFARTLGIQSLAWGALLGAFLGPFLLNAWAAHRAGVRYQPLLDLHDSGLREWVRMSLPLMLGVSVVFMDSIILTWFAKHTTGAISELMYAKRLFTAPMAILGQAAGAASLPFFASLFSQRRFADFAAAVNRSVSQLLSVALLLAAAMFALAQPIVDLVLRGGALDDTAAHATATFFAIFTLSLPLWAAQSIYARAFYGAGETRAPMVGGTLITLLSLPLYYLLHLHFGVPGLAWASDLAILLQTAMLALLAHHRRLVPLSGLNLLELARAATAALLGFLAATLTLLLLPHPAATTPHTAHVHHLATTPHTLQNLSAEPHLIALVTLLAGTAAWLLFSLSTLQTLGSPLPRTLLRRRPA